MQNKTVIYSFLLIAFMLLARIAPAHQNTDTNDARFIVPPLLNKHDKVALVAPGFYCPNIDSIIQKATEIFQSWGLRVVIGKSVKAKYGQFAGDDKTRRVDLQQMLDDPTIRAIIACRGGYGTTRIIDQLDFTAFMQHPKWMIGFSDITALLLSLHKLGVVSVHGEMPYKFLKPGYQSSIASLQALLFRGETAIKTKPSALNRLGEAAGPVVGGNLTLLCDSLGTRSEIDTDHKILVLEEIGGALRCLDRMMVQLKRAGKLAHLAGLVVGRMCAIQDKGQVLLEKSAYEIIKAHVAPYAYPVAFYFPIGHEPPNLAFPHGSIGKLCVQEDRVSLSFVLLPTAAR